LDSCFSLLGGGLPIAVTADVRIAVRDSQFGIPSARLSLAYGQDRRRSRKPTWASTT